MKLYVLLLFLGLTPMISLAQEDADHYYYTGLYKMVEKNYIGAIADFSKSVSLNPKYKEAFNNKGLCYLKLRKHKEALAEFNKSINIDFNYVPAIFNIAYTYYETRDFINAIKYFDKVIAETIDYSEAYYYRGMSKIAINQYETSCFDIKKASSLGHQLALLSEEIFCQ